jgi:CPA2 family monovalent cation:H+ antiporter-2
MHSDLLFGLLVLLALAMGLALLFRSRGWSMLIAYLTAGAIATNLNFVEHDQNVAVIAEIGAVLVLFSLGLELDLDKLRQHFRRIIIVAGVQISLTLSIGSFLIWLLGLSFGASVAIGACLTLSSTLMVLKALDEKGLRNKQEGQTVLGLLLAQDICIGPLMLLVSLANPVSGGGHLWAIGLGTVVLLLATVGLRRALATRVIAKIRGANSNEIDIAFALVMAMGAAMLAEFFHLGAAVGAFLVGLALGDRNHREVVENAVRPIQAPLAVLFFASIGLQFELSVVFDHFFLICIALFISVALKAAIASFAFYLANMPLKSSIGCGMMVGQIGEFSFVIAANGYAGGALDLETYQIIIAIACISLAMTPILISGANRFLPRSRLENIVQLSETIVGAGLGPVGNAVVEALRHAGQPLMLVDRNPKLLETWQDEKDILLHEGRIEDMEDWLPVLGKRPRAVILTFPIPDTSAIVAKNLHRVDADLTVIARSPYIRGIDTLKAAGITHILCDEQAAAVALGPLLARALAHDQRERTEVSSQRLRRISRSFTRQSLEEPAVNETSPSPTNTEASPP